MFGLSALATKALIAVVALGLAFAGGVRLESKVAAGRYEALIASYKGAQVKALQAALDEQKRLDGISTAAAEREATRQARHTALVKRQLSEVKAHVARTAHCVTYGLVRVLDAASSGRLTEHLPLPAGKSDDACAPIDWPTLASNVTDNYGSARANAEQLGALIQFYRDSKR